MFGRSAIKCSTFFLGEVPFHNAWRMQQAIMHERLAGQDRREVLLICQHPLVYTAGRRTPTVPNNPSFDVIRVERGGQLTCHCPGQLVVYPLFDLHLYKMDLRWYISTLESCVINVLDRFGIKGSRHHRYPGVWVGANKLASVGISCSKWLTMHGLSVNIAPDLSHFDAITPCGISSDEGLGVTSIEHLISQKTPKIDEVTTHIINEFQELFNIDCVNDSNSPVLSEQSRPRTIPF
uniref:lipoyl(octanoyl) transferase n=1 Tax=Spongospora subterranea TaxID=70186 RepID=A0A0H5QJF1_9EUKA|eukprot:CRZ01767.1 hypothetical protein [Spongospora subterranea]